MDWRELQDEVNARQTGQLPEDLNGIGVPPGFSADYDDDFLKRYGLEPKSVAQQQAELDALAGAEEETDCRCRKKLKPGHLLALFQVRITRLTF